MMSSEKTDKGIWEPQNVEQDRTSIPNQRFIHIEDC